MDLCCTPKHLAVDLNVTHDGTPDGSIIALKGSMCLATF